MDVNISTKDLRISLLRGRVNLFHVGWRKCESPKKENQSSLIQYERNHLISLSCGRWIKSMEMNSRCLHVDWRWLRPELKGNQSDMSEMVSVKIEGWRRRKCLVRMGKSVENWHAQKYTNSVFNRQVRIGEIRNWTSQKWQKYKNDDEPKTTPKRGVL